MLRLPTLEERQSSLGQLQDHPDEAVRMAVAAALSRVSEVRQGRLVQALLERLGASDAQLKLSALRGVLALPPRVIDEKCAPLLLPLLDDAEYGVRAAAVQALGRLPVEALVLYAAKLLKHPADGGRDILHRIPRDCLALLEQCADPEWTVRLDAVVAIGRLPPSSLALMPRVLLKMMDDSRVGVCSAAAAVLNHMQPSSLGGITEEIGLKLERLPRDGELRAQLLTRLPSKALPTPRSEASAQRL